MESILFPILIAVTVAVMVWAVARAVSGTPVEKRKLQQRLAHEGRPEVGAGLPRAVRMQMEAKGLSGALLRWRVFQKLYRHLLQAYPDLTLARFLGISVGLGIVLMALVAIVLDSAHLGLLAGAIGIYAPFFLLANKRAQRQRLLARQLPEALDFLSRILRAGHSLSTGMQMMSEELPQPLGAEFGRCYDQHSLGQSLEDSLKDMATRIESTDFAFFVTAVLIQRQTGGDLSEVLTNISNMVRQRIRLGEQVKAKTAEGRFSGYVLVAFPVVMFVISYAMNPKHTGVMLHTSTGLMLLGIAFGLEVVGLWSIRKITTVKV